MPPTLVHKLQKALRLQPQHRPGTGAGTGSVAPKRTMQWSPAPWALGRLPGLLYCLSLLQGMDPLSWSQKTNAPVPHPHCSQNSSTLGQRLDGHMDPPGHTGATL